MTANPTEPRSGEPQTEAVIRSGRRRVTRLDEVLALIEKALARRSRQTPGSRAWFETNRVIRELSAQEDRLRGQAAHPAARPDDRRRANGRRRLTDDDVAAIRGHYVAGLTSREIAPLWDIHPSRVQQLVRDIARPRGPRCAAGKVEEPGR